MSMKFEDWYFKTYDEIYNEDDAPMGVFDDYRDFITSIENNKFSTLQFELRGDDLEMIELIKNYIPLEREDIHSWICYLENEILDKLQSE